jgi:hypothetical protein
MSFLLSYVFSSTKWENKRAEQVLPGSGDGEGGTQAMYTHVSKCKIGKIFLKIKKKRIWSIVSKT